MAAIKLLDFEDLYTAVLEEIGEQTSNENALNKVKRYINMVYIDEVLPYKRWYWLEKTAKVIHKSAHNDSTVSVTANSTTATLATVPDVSLGSFKGYKFSTNGFDEIYTVSAHTAGSATVTLDTDYQGVTAAAANYRIWRDRFDLPTDCRETINVDHDRHKYEMKALGRQEMDSYRKNVPKAEGFPDFYHTKDFVDPSTSDAETESDRYRQVMLYPSIHLTENVTMRVTYVQEATELDAAGDEPVMPVEDRIVLYYGAVAYAWKNIARNPDEHDRAWAQFTRKLERMAGRVEERPDTPKIGGNSNYLKGLRAQRLGRKSVQGLFSTGYGSGSGNSDINFLDDVTILRATMSGNLTFNSGITACFSGLTAASVLFLDSSGCITEDTSFAFNSTTNVLTVGSSTYGDAASIASTLTVASTTTTSDVTISSSNPKIDFKDTDGTDSDINAAIEINLTDTGSGTEDADISFKQQVAGSLTETLLLDADGSAHFKVAAVLENQKGLQFSEQTGNGTNYVELVAPDAVTTSTTLKLPDGDGSADQVLKTDGSGNLDWITVSSDEIIDADGDTKIQVEESADEDVIRFDVATAEVLTIDATTATLGLDLDMSSGSQQLILGAGTAGDPAIKIGSFDTGLYADSSALEVSVNNNRKATFASSSLNLDVDLLMDVAASGTDPNITRSNDQDTGLGIAGGNIVHMVAGGAETAQWNTTGVDIKSSLELRLYDSDNTNYTGFKAPSALTGNVTFTLPDGDGSANQVLSTDGASTLSWIDPASGSSTPDYLQNVGIAGSVAASALTVALKQADGSTDPSTGSSAVTISFRNATETNGGYVTRTVTSSLSVTASSGSTLGHASGAQEWIYVYAIDNAGTVELALSTSLFSEERVVSTTAEGGAGAADSATVMYSTTARSNVACRLIGVLRSTQATAGTWATTPAIQGPYRTPRYTLGSKQVFTSSGTWTRPEGCKAAVVEVVGGGASGGGAATTSSSQASAGGGGGAGGYSRKFITLGLGSTETVTVGAGASGSSGAAGSNGGNSSFGAHCSANGGVGGGIGSATSGTGSGGSGGAGGSATGGDINVGGGAGFSVLRSGTSGVTLAISGSGGSSVFGGGGGGDGTTTGTVSGENGSGYGAGGSGAAHGPSQVNRAGGDGSSGIVIVWEFY